MAKNIGILASMSWNSNGWQEPATREDIARSNFDYVKENGWMHEDLNFGFKKYVLEADGNYIAYTPQFNTLPALEESKYVSIVFFKSFNYHNSKNLIVGCYAFPDIGNFARNAEDKMYEMYDFGNVKTTPECIVRFNNPVEISVELCATKGYLPKGKKLGKKLLERHKTIEELLKIIGIPEKNILIETEKIEHTLSSNSICYIKKYIENVNKDKY